jgi:DNA mismatch repair protein MutS2
LNEVITEREIKILEFDQIRMQLASLTVSPMAEKLAAELIPSASLAEVEKMQGETAEGRLLVYRNAFAPSAVEDISLLLSRALKGALLPGTDLAAVLSFIKAARRWHVFFKESDQQSIYPLLAGLSAQIRGCPELSSALERSIDQEGSILDSASPALSSLRRKKLVSQSKIREKLDDYIRSATYRRYLQEALVTIRNGRYVLPVKQEYRQNIDGVVHDQSSSGATVFIEPLPVVQMQNELTAIQRQEEQEIERILYQLSGQVAAFSDDLAVNRTLYGELDFIVARGHLSIAMDGNEPELASGEEDQLLLLDNAVHPLLVGDKVPLNLKLGGQVKTLVVTGPNTGGKTVSLKTIGLLSAMAQSGLQVPAGKETCLPVFRQIRADIGDEQSIAQSLSTFSGHMKNIIEIVEQAGPGSLVLFDELGAGTDPSEGSALAMAILEELTRRGAMTIATTHINELKLFAQVQDKMQNAAMEFDPDTLAPTYRLLQGVPGQSNAFYITEQLGLPGKVLQRAKGFVHRSHDQVESVIASLVEDQQRFQRDSRQAAVDRSRAELVMEELEQERELLRARREDILKEAREEARQMIRKTKSLSDQLIRELRMIKPGDGENPLLRAEKVRQDLGLLRQEIDLDDTGDIDDSVSLTAEDLSAGQQVYIRSLRQKGEIVSFSSDEALVQVGSMKVHLPFHELKLERKADQSKETSKKTADRGSYSVTKELGISSSIDLRGLNLDEAQPLVEKLLDNALWAGLNRVDIIHGKGTGKLRQGLRSYLKEHSLVGSLRSGTAAEGGEGVTVVELKG